MFVSVLPANVVVHLQLIGYGANQNAIFRVVVETSSSREKSILIVVYALLALLHVVQTCFHTVNRNVQRVVTRKAYGRMAFSRERATLIFVVVLLVRIAPVFVVQTTSWKGTTILTCGGIHPVVVVVVVVRHEEVS